jgi:hypothetical protein
MVIERSAYRDLQKVAKSPRSVEGVMGFTLVLAIEVEITHWEGILVGCL